MRCVQLFTGATTLRALNLSWRHKVFAERSGRDKVLALGAHVTVDLSAAQQVQAITPPCEPHGRT